MECRLMERQCTHCGECERCDLDPEKICDNCCACLEEPSVDYASIPVTLKADENEDKTKRSHPRKRER